MCYDSLGEGALQIAKQSQTPLQICVSTCIDKYVQFSYVCFELKYKQHFLELRQRITGIWVAQKCLAHLRATPKLRFHNKSWMLFSMCKHMGWCLSTGIMKNDPLPTCLRRLGWVGTGVLVLAEECCSFFFFYLVGILLTHFNSHSSLKRPLHCSSHLLWFVF